MDGKTNDEYDSSATRQLTDEQAILVLGSEAELKKRIDNKTMKRNDNGTVSFVTQKTDLLTTTVLHEVGHSVDHMLGERTDLIYDQAGWKQFSAADFDGWATALGGWDGVKGPDKVKIREAWTSWLRGGAIGTVNDLVDSGHPLNDVQYLKVGVVELARQPAGTATEINGVVARGEYSKQAFYLLSQRAYHSTPSAYALTAPGEYFAECYANYYREYDGTPATADKKGASLAPWIKTWFDERVDTIGHNPQRNGKTAQ